jgi:hypothetical protein
MLKRRKNPEIFQGIYRFLMHLCNFYDKMEEKRHETSAGKAVVDDRWRTGACLYLSRHPAKRDSIGCLSYVVGSGIFIGVGGDLLGNPS